MNAEEIREEPHGVEQCKWLQEIAAQLAEQFARTSMAEKLTIARQYV